MGGQKTFDVAVIGAGVFGAWTAWHVARRGQRVVLIDACGPAHSRASSGGDSRIIRMGYGADEIYTRWSQRSLVQWKELFAARSQEALFQETGVLWLSGGDDARFRQTAATLTRCGVPFEEVGVQAIEKRFPQIGLAGITAGLLEPHSGALMARRAVAAVVEDAVQQGAEYRNAQVLTPTGLGRLRHVATNHGENIAAEQFVFACGPWLGKVFPDILGARIFPSPQEVFFFCVPARDPPLAPPPLPPFLFQVDELFAIP